MTLTDFLLARIGEDEALASAAYGDLTTGNDESETGTGWATRHYEHNTLSAPSYQWQRHHSPERALAECEAKRRIVSVATEGCECQASGTALGNPDWDRQVLAFLALPYADHADYRSEWRP